MNAGKIKIVDDALPARGRKALLRLDLNVPILDGKVQDDYRIKKIFPTLEFLAKAGARVFILSHIESGDKTLKPVYDYLSGFFNVSFAESLEQAESMAPNMADGEFVLVENIRNEKGETENDPNLAKRLASLGDFFVNEAFSVSHRNHASIVGIPKHISSYAGYQFMEEIRNLSLAMSPEKPALLILGGAKLETKLPLLKKFAGIYDSVFVGGALANEIFRVKANTQALPELKEIISKSDFYLPEDAVVSGVDGDVEILKTKEGEKMVDCGERTSVLLESLVKKSKFVLWNGTLGVCEEGFCRGTRSLIEVLASGDAEVFAGGGDTVSEIDKAGATSKFAFVSTGGGAMLDFLASGTLPGIDVLVSK